MYYPSSENKGADQLRGYREADLRLCFRICRLLVFPWGGSFINSRGLLPRYVFEPVHEKPKHLGSDQVRHIPGCTSTEYGSRLESLDLESIGLVRNY